MLSAAALLVLAGAAVQWPLTAPVHRVPAVRMQLTNRDRVLDELSSFENEIQTGATRRAVVAGLAAGAVGLLSGSSLDVSRTDDEAIKQRLADKEKQLAATARLIEEKEAKLQELAERTRAVEAEVARAKVKPLPRREPLKFDFLDEIFQQIQKSLPDQPPTLTPEQIEEELLARITAAEERVISAESRLAQAREQAQKQQEIAEQRELARKEAAAAVAQGALDATPSLSLDSPILETLGVTALFEAALLLAANFQIFGLRNRVADANTIADARISQITSELQGSLEIATAEAIEARARLDVVQGHAEMLANEVEAIEQELATIRERGPLGKPPPPEDDKQQNTSFALANEEEAKR
eukprot:scaffold130410_cov26-Tisochrysis_lutea.AAC.1